MRCFDSHISAMIQTVQPNVSNRRVEKIFFAPQPPSGFPLMRRPSAPQFWSQQGGMMHHTITRVRPQRSNIRLQWHQGPIQCQELVLTLRSRVQ